MERMRIRQLLLVFICWGIFSALDIRAETRKGDAIYAYTVATSQSRVGDGTKGRRFLPGIQNCLSSNILVQRGLQISFDGGVTTQPVTGDSILRLSAHEGVVYDAQVSELGKGTPSEERAKVSVQWTTCSFDSDEAFALQILFAVGSIASILVFVTILFDSRMKRPDKFS